MQQPYGQQSGSYGNTPYAGAPPKRGFNWLFCCLGCLGLAFVAALILGALLFMRVSKGAGPAITETTYRSEFPADVPVYPGLKFDAKMSAPMRFASGVIGLVPKANGMKLRMMVFQSPKPAADVAQWYKQQLVPQGWRFSTSTGGQGGPASQYTQGKTSWQFLKADRILLIVDMNQPRSNAVMVAVGKGFPANPNTNIKVNR